MSDVIISGYISLDRIIKINPSAKVGATSIVQNDDNNLLTYGGCNINVSIDLAKLNISALPIIRVGYDYQSSGFQAFLHRHHISEDATIVIPNVATSCCYLVEDPAGNHMTLYYPGAMNAQYFQPYADCWFHQAKIALMTVASTVDNYEFLKLAKKHHVPLYLGMKLDEDAFPPSFLKELLPNLKGIFCNRSEEKYFLKIFNLRHLSQLFDDCPQLHFIIVTQGKNGSIAYTRELINPLKVGIALPDVIRSNVGSGDGYISGFIYGLLNNFSLKKSMEYGATLASYILEGAGATNTAPNLQQLNARHQHNFIKED